MPTYDMCCRDCGEVYSHFSFIGEMERRLVDKADDPVYKLHCPSCKSDTLQTQSYAGGKRNGIHSQHSGMYGKYHHGFGCVVDDYGHKQRLLKKYGLHEAADSIGGSKSVLGDRDIMGGTWQGDGIDKKEVEQHKKESQEAMDSVVWSSGQ